MSDLERELNFYRQQYNESGKQALGLQEDQTQARWQARRSHMLALLIRESYQRIANSDISMDEIGQRFLQVVLGTLNVDRAVILKYLTEEGCFIAQYFQGFPKDMLPRFTPPDLPGEFYFINSNRAPDPLESSLQQVVGVPYLVWAFNPRAGVGLLVGNVTEDQHLHCPFEEHDRELIEGALDVFIDITERKRAEEELRKHCDHLEELVKERTSELTTTDEHLRREITERKRVEESLQHRNRDLTLLNRVGQLFNSTIELNQVLVTVLSETRRLLHIAAASFWLLDRGTGEFVCQQAVGPGSETVMGWRLSLGQGIAGHAAQTGEIIHVRDTRVDTQHYKGVDQKTGIEFRSIVSLPFQAKGTVIGVLNLVDTLANRFTADDLRLVESIATVAANAIEKAHLYMTAQQEIAERKQAEEALSNYYDHLETLVEIRTSELTEVNQQLRQEITERKHAEKALQRAKEAAENADRAKSDFLANMSHELRTPLNHIIGFTELVVDQHFGDLNETQEDYLNDVLHSSKHLLSLINDILDLSKVEAGKLELDPSKVNLRMLLENSLIMIKEKAMKHSIQVSTEIQDIPDTLIADERKLKQILYNLLSNAVKFTPDGGEVRLNARMVECFVRSGFRWEDPKNLEVIDIQVHQSEVTGTKRKKCVEFSVSDTGIGIRAEDLGRIFKPFEQVESSTSRRVQGTGLGLPLTTRLVKLHGGRIWAESEGEGERKYLYMDYSGLFLWIPIAS